MSPMVVGAEITDFPPNFGLPQSTYIHDPSFPAVPLYDANATPGTRVLVGYLLSAGHGGDVAGQGPPPNEATPLIDVNSPVMFGVASGTTGLDPGMGPDISNSRVEPLVADMSGPAPRFVDGDAINSFSFGRDGTGSTGLGALFFSVDPGSTGEAGCRNAVNLAATTAGNQAPTVFAASAPSFGAYSGIPTPRLAPNDNFLAVDSTGLGLRVSSDERVTALELSQYSSTADLFYATFTGDWFECAGGCNDDCNGNGLHDTCDIQTGVSPDGNGDGIPDECQYCAEFFPPDCNNNGLPDECDIDCGAPGGPCDLPGCGGSSDADADGIPDDCQQCAFPAPGGQRTANIYVYSNADDLDGSLDFCDLRLLAFADDLGLQDMDVIDALALSDISPSPPFDHPDGVMSPGSDEVLFSLARGSPTLTAEGRSAADVFVSSFTVGHAVFTSYTELALLEGDNVDAIDIRPGPPSIIPTLSERGLMVMTLLALTAATILFGRRRPAAA